jgi:hypothetical protein
MPATMAKQGGWVQLEQSGTHFALNLTNMPIGGYSRAGIKETQQLFKKHHTKVREEKKRGVVFLEHNMLKAAIE